MTNTQYYNLTKAEGSDTVNLLTQNYPNFDIIDNAMHANAVATVSTAVETKVGTTHQIVRTNSECAMFRFVATSNWTAGDSFTVDGVAVTAVAVDGQALQTGAFIINANVLCCVVGGLMTVYVGGGSAIAEDSNKLGGQLPAYYAKQSEVTQLNSNLTAKTTIDISNTSIPVGTSFENIIKMLTEKVFPKIATITGSLFTPTSGSYLDYDNTRYNPINTTITVPNLLTAVYADGGKWNITPSYNGVIKYNGLTETLTNGILKQIQLSGQTVIEIDLNL